MNIMNTKQNNISKALNSIKVYTIFLVVIGHVLVNYCPSGTFPHHGSFITSWIYNIIYSFHMPLFISVSGAVYAICRNKGKYSNWKSLIRSKWSRVLIPYITFGLFILFPTLRILNINDDNILNYSLSTILLGKDGGGLKHLWYLYVLFEMFVITYGIEKIINKYNVYYVLFTFMCITIAAYSIQLPTMFQLNMLLRYYLFFIIGYYIGRGNIKIKNNIIIELLLIIAGLAGCYFMYQLPTFWCSLVSTTTAICFMIVAYQVCQKYSLGSGSFIYNCILKDGMGIYLFHVIIIYILFYFDIFANYGIYIQSGLIVLISFISSIITTRFVRLIHCGFLIGELKQKINKTSKS